MKGCEMLRKTCYLITSNQNIDTCKNLSFSRLKYLDYISPSLLITTSKFQSNNGDEEKSLLFLI